jgi:hypothetical protein
MSIRATSILRSIALPGAATAASAMLAQVAMAGGYGPPGVSPYFYSSSVNHGSALSAPRPDYPGFKQFNIAKVPHNAKHHKTASRQ